MAIAHCHLPDAHLIRDVFCYAFVEQAIPAHYAFPTNSLFFTIGDTQLQIDGEPWPETTVLSVLPNRALRIEKGQGTLLIIDFLAGGLSRLFGIDAGAEVGAPRPLDSKRHRALVDLEPAVRHSDTTRLALIKTVDQVLCSRLGVREAEGYPEQAYESIISGIEPDIDSTALAAKFGISLRTLQRTYKRRFGVTMARNRRLHKFVASLRSGQGRVPGWNNLPPTLAYADQSHYLRDARELTGVKPAEFEFSKNYERLFYPRGTFDEGQASDDPVKLSDWDIHVHNPAAKD